jgi:hypothetical protein
LYHHYKLLSGSHGGCFDGGDPGFVIIYPASLENGKVPIVSFPEDDDAKVVGKIGGIEWR